MYKRILNAFTAVGLKPSNERERERSMLNQRTIDKYLQH